MLLRCYFFLDYYLQRRLAQKVLDVTQGTLYYLALGKER